MTHFWYEADNAEPEKFLDVVKVGNDFPVLIEIRTGRGQYTVIPPSRIPVTKGNAEFETLHWFSEGAALRCAFPSLRLAVCYCAVTALLARHYAPDGVRWEFYEALAGFFLGSLKLQVDVARIIIETAADMVGDRDTKPGPAYWIVQTEDRLKASQTCTGAPKVAQLIGEHGPVVIAQIRKWLGNGDDLVLNPNDPLPSARQFVEREHTIKDTLALRHQAGVFFAYTTDAGAYLERDEAAVRSHLYRFLESAKRWTEKELVAFQPTKAKVENVLDALRAVCNLPTSIVPPSWLNASSHLDPFDMLAAPNGLLHIPTRTHYQPTPHFFTLNSIEFPYDSNATAPTRWLAFLSSLWPEDEQSIQTLQEIFGYALTPDTRFQKIFMTVGPPRSGKGVTGRVMQL